MPLKIVRPDLNLSLFDALAKRTRFLREAVDKIGISDVRILHTRAEEAARKEPDRDAFDVSIARAVAPLSVLAEYCLPLVRPGGYFIAMKGDVRDELEAADGAWSALGGEFEQTLSFVLPGTTMRRSLVVVGRFPVRRIASPDRTLKFERNRSAEHLKLCLFSVQAAAVMVYYGTITNRLFDVLRRRSQHGR